MRKRRTVACLCMLWLAFVMAAGNAYANDNPIRIAAASSMRFVLDALIDAYHTTDTAMQLQPVYGSSGNLYRQIVQGAPFDLFLSADSTLLDQLVESGHVSQQQVFGHGRLMLYTSNAIPANKLFDEFTGAIASGKLQGNVFQVAIGNPSHAPYGKAAQQALQQLNLWNDTQPYLVVADNVSQAAQFAQTGSVAFAFVANALVSQLSGQAVAMNPEHYAPVLLSLGVINRLPDVHSFLVFVRSAKAQQIIDQHGLLAR